MQRRKIRRVVSRLSFVVAETPIDSFGCTIHTPGKASNVLNFLRKEAQEVFGILLLDGKHKIKDYAEISRGSLTTSIVHPREVFGPAIRLAAAAIIVAHNHPSGDPSPSQEDIAVTERLIKAGEILGIPVLDHLILGLGKSYISLRNLKMELWK